MFVCNFADENRGTSAALGETEGSESAAGASAPKTFTSGDSGGLQASSCRI